MKPESHVTSGKNVLDRFWSFAGQGGVKIQHNLAGLYNCTSLKNLWNKFWKVKICDPNSTNTSAGTARRGFNLISCCTSPDYSVTIPVTVTVTCPHCEIVNQDIVWGKIKLTTISNVLKFVVSVILID